MTASNGDWKTYFLGIFATVILALSGAGYKSIDYRVTSLETTRTDAAIDTRTLAVQAAIVSTQVTELQNRVTELSSQVESLNRKVNDLTFVISKNTKVYQDAMVRWNEEIRTRPTKKD